MVYKSAAINCRSGYDEESKDPNVTFHAFPLHDQQLLQAWHKRLARKDFTPTKYSKLCSIHFPPEDFVTESTDQSNRRKRKRESRKLIRRHLKNDAHPTILPICPHITLIKVDLDVPVYHHLPHVTKIKLQD